MTLNLKGAEVSSKRSKVCTAHSSMAQFVTKLKNVAKKHRTKQSEICACPLASLLTVVSSPKSCPQVPSGKLT